MIFQAFPKIPRLNRNCTITEKIDGTNAVICIEEHPDGQHTLLAGSRNRWLTPDDDNFGFATWVNSNALELLKLGPGTQHGEWWGGSIQRGYGLKNKRFSLFNTARWGDPSARPACCGIVPVLYEGPFDTQIVRDCLSGLALNGSAAAPGFRDPEGIVVYHHAAGSLFKVTIQGDEEGKHAEAHPKKERKPQMHKPKDPSKGGRRKEQLPFDGEDRRKK